LEDTFIHRGGIGLDTKVKALEIAKGCLDKKVNFVMQGGAGSGKTETLKELLLYLSDRFPDAKVACITHTNLAVDEIRSRIGDRYTISTIHSFLYDNIKNYKKNIKVVIEDLFTVPMMERGELLKGESEKDYNKFEHEKYKKAYEKYSDVLYSIKKEKIEKYAGKREYDKEPVIYNTTLNTMILKLNEDIKNIIAEFDHSKIKYNETKFNNFKELSYGHDGLLDLAYLLFKKYPLLNKILCDKFDYIFIDEYQDTRSEIVEIFLSQSPSTKPPTICMFGDIMQSIYNDGIGDASNYVREGKLTFISKEDNYRCSEQVLEFINPLRLDGIEQKVAFKTNRDGVLETLPQRQGKVLTLYAVFDNKPNAFSDQSSKDSYNNSINKLVSIAQSKMGEHKVLLLTNKAISKKVGFNNLYNVFDKRYVDVGERMDDLLKRMQVIDLCELCFYFKNRQFGYLINAIKLNGFVIKQLSDKQQISEKINSLLNGSLSIAEALELGFESKLLKKSETFEQYLNRQVLFQEEIKNNKDFQVFKNHYENGFNTFARMKEKLTNIFEEEFKENENLWKQERFYKEIFSKEILFSEALNYYNYINEGTQYITMHKTKGSGIDSVLVVMDEYFWNSEYDFSLIYSGDSIKKEKREKSQKLIYVACSRAIANLTCIKLISPEEEQAFLQFFSNAERVDIAQ
jgi:DNA helicase-2/ATP-dependent DNA helicase PcrA